MVTTQNVKPRWSVTEDGTTAYTMCVKILPHQDTATEETYSCFKCSIQKKVNFEKNAEKSWYLLLRNFCLFYYPKTAIMLQHHNIQFSFHYLSTGRLRKVKNKIKFQICRTGLKVVAVAYGGGRLQEWQVSK